jgi:Axonemal dynein light chain
LKSLLDKHFNEIYRQRDVLTSLTTIENAIDKLQFSTTTSQQNSPNAIYQTYPRQSLLSLGRPAGRRECILLSEWIDDRVNSLPIKDKVSVSKLIFDFSLLEIIRQVSINCVERGNLLKRLIENIKDYYEQYLEQQLKSHIELEATLKIKINGLQSTINEYKDETNQVNPITRKTLRFSN